MEPSQENSPISTSKTDKSLSTRKFRQNTKHNWVELKVEYLTGNVIDVSEFGRVHGINPNTLNKQTTGWREEYVKRQESIAQKALKADGLKKLSALARRSKAGRTLLVKSIREFSKRNLAEVSPEDLAKIAKVGAELEEVKAEQQSGNTFNTQVNIGQIPSEVADALRTWVQVHPRIASDSREA